jgi:hypothetical protein
MSGKKKKVTEEEALLINSQLAKDKGFGIDVARIGEITSRRDLENLKKVGATLGVAKSMKVNPNVGLSQDEANDDYADRKAVYVLLTPRLQRLNLFQSKETANSMGGNLAFIFATICTNQKLI